MALFERAGVGRSEWLAVAAIALVAGALRLAFLAWMEFKGDEAVALELAAAMLDGDGVARVGLMSSVGIPNPPVFIWWIAGAMQLSRDPVVVTALAVALPATAAVPLTWWIVRDRAAPWLGIGAAATMACAPWAVLYGRKIWAQDTLPLLCVCLLGALFAVAERDRTRAVLWVPVLVALLWQIHFSATGLALVAGVVLAWRARRRHGPALAAGTLVALLTLAPYLDHLRDTGFADLARMAGDPAASDASDERVGIAEVVGAAARHTASISAGTDLTYALGRRSAADFAERTGCAPAALATVGGWRATDGATTTAAAIPGTRGPRPSRSWPASRAPRSRAGSRSDPARAGESASAATRPRRWSCRPPGRATPSRTASTCTRPSASRP